MDNQSDDIYNIMAKTKTLKTEDLATRIQPKNCSAAIVTGDSCLICHYTTNPYFQF